MRTLSGGTVSACDTWAIALTRREALVLTAMGGSSFLAAPPRLLVRTLS
jgi:hypothetical protein